MPPRPASPTTIIPPSNPNEAPFELGAMYWQNPRDGDAELDAEMRRIRAHHFSVIRAFINWEHVEQKRGLLDFSLYDGLYEAAARHGLRIAQTLGIYPPYWMTRLLREKNLLGDDRYQCIDIPDFSEPLSHFIKATVTRYAAHPAQGMWFVWNEPEKAPCACPHTEKKFRQWLRNKYGTIGNLHARWGSERHIFHAAYAPGDFDSVSLAELKATLIAEKRNYPWVLDWYQFAQDNLADNLRWLADQVRAHDPVHPTHANPYAILHNSVGKGVDLWKLSSALDVIGISIHPCHFFKRDCDGADPLAFPPHTAFAYMLDIAASAARQTGRGFWISELQAGANINSGNTVFSPSAADIRAWILHTAARGGQGLLFWLWRAWRSAWECGEFSLVNGVDGSDTDRSRMAARCGALLENAREHLATVRPAAARAAILFSLDSQALALRETRPVDWPLRAMFGIYRALWKHNIAVDFITPEKIAEGLLMPERYSALFIPYAKLVTVETGAKIAAYARAGGALWADGHCALRGEHSHLHAHNPGAGLDEVFGCREEDLAADDEAFDILLENGSRCPGHLFQQWLHPLETAGNAPRVTGHFANGKPAIVENTHGKGATMYVGTYLAIEYQRRENPAAEQLIVDFARKTGALPKIIIEAIPPDAQFEASLMTGETHNIIVITNRSGARATARLRTGAGRDWQRLADLETGLTFAGNIEFEPGDTRMLRADKTT